MNINEKRMCFGILFIIIVIFKVNIDFIFLFIVLIIWIFRLIINRKDDRVYVNYI